MKLLTPRMHGYLDFVVVALFALAPAVLNFSATPARISYSLAVVHLALTLFTRFPAGIVKVVPFPIHGGIRVHRRLHSAGDPFPLRIRF